MNDADSIDRKIKMLRISANHHAILDAALDEVLNFESPPPFDSAESVREYLATREVGNEA